MQEGQEDKHFGIYPGIVVDNADPQSRGRVKIKVPGLCEPSTNWALPIGGSHSSGESGRGAFDPPKKKAAVAVAFLDGDIDHPVYLGGWRGLVSGKTDAPADAAGATPDDAANKVKAYESDLFAITIDERSGAEYLTVKSKSGTSIVLDNDGTVTVTAKKILLGDSSASEPFVLGGKWQTLMQTLIQAIIQHFHTTAVGPDSPSANFPPAIQAELTKLAQGAHLSKISFGE